MKKILPPVLEELLLVKEMSIQIASAVEEQSSVSEEISRNVHNLP